MTEIRPFALAVPQDQLDDLNRRLDLTRWAERETVGDWSQGTPLAVLQDLVAYWRHGYDWRACEARLNGLGQAVNLVERCRGRIEIELCETGIFKTFGHIAHL